MQEKRIPFAGEFSPGQIRLGRVLALASEASSEKAFVEAVRTEYFLESCPSYSGERRVEQQSKRARNVFLGMRAYGLLSEPFELSDLGRELLSADEKASYSRFAAHIISESEGRAVLDALKNLQAKGESVTKDSLSNELRRSGYQMPNATTAHQTLLNWLRQADLFTSKRGYDVNPVRLGLILGTNETILTDLDRLGHAERAFLSALANLITEDDQSFKVSDVMDYAREISNLKVKEDQWRSKLLTPLKNAGWITLETGTTGRGAKSGRLKPTGVFKSSFLAPLLRQKTLDMPPELKAGLNRPLQQILKEMDSDDTHVKGTALEHLAGRITQLLDLKPKHLRLRSAQTGGTEIDLIAESTKLIFSRWQVQCKNTKALAADDVAKEVGIAVALRSQVILMITTGRVGNVVAQFSRQINETTAMQVIVLDGSDLKVLADDPSAAGTSLTKLLESRAEQVMKQKAGQRHVEVS